ncbi:YciI family protein [Egicoccus halophilus]|uniref:Dehydrogenase n=1 Tax=Egicoccus halophilus TaxID=1670830 RepID=A0A8J3A589_9ACTN|nr:YciI family protein [Egicoccus halophilus]GGI02576.1 dehydrogenase [Egicoccus halophilus]
MRVMVLMKATEQSETGEMPSQELLEQMTTYNEELVASGMLLAGDGLHPSSKGVRVEFDGDERRVVDGPFAATEEVVSGYWLWQVASMDEAVAWVRRIPNPDGEHTVVELRPVFEADDFGDAFTPELREREQQLERQVRG